MMDRMTVYVNGKPVSIHPGMKVKHALIAFDEALYFACRDGHGFVETEEGFRVDLEGALTDGSRIVTKKVNNK
jgi:hypothetical protein